jgi:hypothetical protein
MSLPNSPRMPPRELEFSRATSHMTMTYPTYDNDLPVATTNGIYFSLGLWMPILDGYINNDGFSVRLLLNLLFVCRDWSAVICLSRHYSQCVSKAIIPSIHTGHSLKFPWPSSFPLDGLPEYGVFVVNDRVHCSVLDGSGRVVISGSSIATVDSYTGYGGRSELPATLSHFDHSNIWIPTHGTGLSSEGRSHERCIAIAKEMCGYNIVCVRERRTARGGSVLKLILFEPIVLSD